jgi:peptidoglycan-associated lipoprotein
MNSSRPISKLASSFALLSLAALVSFSGCAKSVKSTGTGGPGSTSGSEGIYDGLGLPARGNFNPENADYSVLAAYTVYFAFDSYAIDGSERGKLEKTAAWLNENPSAQIIVAGHTDSRGTIQYNVGLGERRAIAVRTYLLGLGIDSARVNTISYGEERPAQPGESESAHTANRRAAIGVLR